MAVKLTDEFGNRANPSSPAYPSGSLKDETNPGVSNDGSPLSSRVGNDFQGFMQSALSEAGIDANGNPDSVDNPQILNALKKVQENHAPTYTGIVYKASGGKTAIENMIAGIPVPASINSIVEIAGYKSDGDEGSGARYLIKTGTGDGYVNHNLDSGLMAELQYGSTLIAGQCGLIVGDGPVSSRPSMSDVLDAIAAHISPNYIYPTRRPEAVSTKVDLGRKPFRITRPFYQPAFTNFELQCTPTFAWDGISATSEDESFIYCDWENGEKDCAWNYAGWWLSDKGSAAAGDRLNQFKQTINSSDYNAGIISLTYGCESKLVLYTDKYIGSAMGVFAATTSKFNLSANGFLHPVVTATCWAGEGEIHAVSYHSGLYTYNSNSWEFSGYSSKKSSGTPPAFDASTVPNGWYEHPVHNPPSVAYYTTGLYAAYSNSLGTKNLVTEGWERGRLFLNSLGIAEVAPYTEQIVDIGIHNVNSEVEWIGGIKSTSLLSNGFIFSTSDAHTIIDLRATDGNGITRWINSLSPTNPTYQRSSVEVKVRDASYADKNTSEILKYTFSSPDNIEIYVSNSSGNDLNEGVSEGSPVKSINIAVERLMKYDAKVINVDASSPVSFADQTEIITGRDITFSPYNGDSANIIPLESGSALKGFLLDGTNSLDFDRVSLNATPSAAPTPSASGVIRVNGGMLSLNFYNTNNVCDNSSCIFVSGSSSTSAVINFVSSLSAYSGEIANNSASPRGVTKVLLASSEDISAKFASSYSIL